MSDSSSPLRGAIERLSGFVDDLLAERRPRRFRAQSEEELSLLKAAARLRGTRPGADRPDPAFMEELREQLSAEGGPFDGLRADSAVEVGERESGTAGEREPGSRGRRRLLAGIAALAAAVAAGFGLGRSGQLSQLRVFSTESGEPLVGGDGSWQRVAALADLPVGRVLRFTAGPLEGHLLSTKDGIRALSAVCTHQGCILKWSGREREFECPCHGASFDSAGQMKYGPASYRDPLPPLSPIETRVADGHVYVWTV